LKKFGRLLSSLYVLLFLVISGITVVQVDAAPVCSFSHSVKGCSIYLTPVFNVDVAYYQWSIAPGDGTTALGVTDWIPASSLFTQMFSLDHEGVYRVSLQAKNGSLTSEYSKLISTTGSMQSVAAIQTQPSPANETFVSRFQSWFNSFPLLVQAAFILIVVFLSIISFDAVFHVSRGWKKKVFYKTSEMKK